MATRYFSLDEARALLPRVRAVLGQALQLHGHLRASIAALGGAGHEVDWALLRGEQELDGADELASEGLARARMIYDTLRESVAGLEGLGVQVKSVLNGLVDFHSWCDDEREVLLCYKLGELDIGFFHDLDVGFAGRETVEGHRFTSERGPASYDSKHEFEDSPQRQ